MEQLNLFIPQNTATESTRATLATAVDDAKTRAQSAGVTIPALTATQAGARAPQRQSNWRKFCPQLSSDVVVLTANKRLARALLEDYAQWQHEQGVQVWPRVDILPWQAWCRHEWERPLEEYVPRVLSEAQSERLWHQVISAAPAEWAGERVNPVPSQCVQPAAEAWQLLLAYGLNVDVLTAEPDLEAQILSQWISDYAQSLAALNAIDQAQLPGALAAEIRQARRPLPRQVVLAGFHELPAALAGVQASLQARGCRVERLEPPQINTQSWLWAATDSEEEARAAAQWARARIAANPQARVAVVVLDLAQQRSLLERAFSETLQASMALSPHADGERPFNISLGWPLAEEPVVHDALLALRWLIEPLDFPRLSVLLRSPFIVVHGPRQAQLELRLRELNFARASLDQVLQLVGGSEERPWRNPRWAARWRQFRQHLRNVVGAQSPLFWAQQMAAALAQLGWAQTLDQPTQAAFEAGAALGQRSLSSREYQALGAFQECLEQLAELHVVVPQCSLVQAIHELEQLAQGQIFQAQQAPAPILITEPLQALGLEFDHLWLMGASDDVWPEAPRPNPLLPLSLQRRHHMPHASAAHELRYAQTITDWLSASAAEVVYSWPQVSGDKPLRPSPLLAMGAALTPHAEHALGIATEADTPTQVKGSVRALPQELLLDRARLAQPRQELEALAQADCEIFQDERAPALAAGLASGGAALIKEQAACPFRALALHRWQVRPPARVSGGLNALQRGQLLHRALELLYTLSEGVLAAPGAWPQWVAKSVAQALTEQQEHWSALNDERLWANESERLQRALDDWLKLDAARPEGFHVRYQEAERELNLGPLRLRLRVDRLDQLADGSGVLIDYKGGQNHSYREWFGARPREPQLPLYALALAQELTLAAVAFGNLKAGQRAYSGLARDEDLLPGVKSYTSARDLDFSDWAALYHHWQSQLEPLAQDFAAGWAAVDPRDHQVCRHCELTALCRIRDGAVVSGLDEEADVE